MLYRSKFRHRANPMNLSLFKHNFHKILALWVFAPLFVFTHASQAIGAEDLQINAETLMSTVQEFAQAVGTGDTVTAGQRDFVCLYKMRQENKITEGNFPPSLDPVYDWCSQRRESAHANAIVQKDRGLDAIWPGKGQLVDFADFQRFFIAETGGRQLSPSFFVMRQLALLQTGTPFHIEMIGTARLPHASFRLTEYDPVVAAPTTMVTVRVSYPDPITSPVSNAPGSQDWVVPYKKPRRIVKSVKVKWVVLSDLKNLGFPTDHAVLDIPLEGSYGTPIPFVIEAGGFLPKSTEWWGPDDAPNSLNEAIQEAKSSSNRHEAVMLLNRVLLVDPRNQEALEALSQQLYMGLLAYGGKLHGIQVSQEELARRFNELYWTVQSQTDRMDISLHMEMGGKAEPTPADYIYRMIPVMEALSSLQPGDFENRLRLGIAYRWTNDQMAAITTPQKLLSEVPSEDIHLRARILLELAWARIGKVAWNRHFDDPDIIKGYEEAETALKMTNDPLDKFTAAYTMAYSLAFNVNRDNQTMLQLLQEARRWFDQLPGSSSEAWGYLLQNDTIKGFVDTDPSFQSLLAAT